jgi:hypothetical protein
MKRSWPNVLSIALLSIAFALGSIAQAQEPPIAGGYSETSISDPEVVSAARYAVRAQGQKQRAPISLVSIRSAEVQVVAGLNYRLGLSVKINGRAQDVTAVVYRNLKQQYSLSTWEVATMSGSAPASTIEQLVKTLAEAYAARTLGQLDSESFVFGKVAIVIEHSLADDNAKGRFVTKAFKTFGEAEQWLRSRERDEQPGREIRPFRRCSRGLCTFDLEGGITHNRLYLQKVGYGYRKGRPYIKKIYLLDGD